MSAKKSQSALAVPPTEEPGALTPPPPTEEMVAQFLALQRDRNILEDKRLNLQEKGLELANTQDLRQFEFHTKRSDQHHERSVARLDFARHLIWALLAVVALVGGVLLWFLFFGNDFQSDSALRVLETILTAVGGFGAGYAGLLAFRWLMGPRE